ncbi:hypothetical protein DAEQUDRAFT_210471 [Daedalea quercina L-15889]|uniref:Uncharacterized protein n=1 Tax=Daedalea quercina L-15889 TaxID=1314783 RepID=A0A165RAP3_9APHY|nr:hypothetical protein DAEQUDRAFT_210471 [Daedalea quercina L-15889]
MRPTRSSFFLSLFDPTVADSRLRSSCIYDTHRWLYDCICSVALHQPPSGNVMASDKSALHELPSKTHSRFKSTSVARPEMLCDP